MLRKIEMDVHEGGKTTYTGGSLLNLCMTQRQPWMHSYQYIPRLDSPKSSIRNSVFDTYSKKKLLT
jgi:hypothetical protein